MGSIPCRRFSLLAIAYPVVGKYFQVLEVHREMKHIQDFSCEKARLWLIHVFCKILDSYQLAVKFLIVHSIFVYVMRKNYNKTHFCKIYAVW